MLHLERRKFAMAYPTFAAISTEQYNNYWQQFAFCQAYESRYIEQAEYKKQYWLSFFQHSLHVAPSLLKDTELFLSPPQHFRTRIEFALRFFADELSYAMFHPGDKTAIKITQCQHSSKAISEAMPCLMQELNRHPILAQRCNQINFRSNTQGQLLITLIYRQAISDKTLPFQQQITRLNEHYGWDIIVRSHKQQWSCEKNYLDYNLQLNDKTYNYRQDDNTFTQPNQYINQQMLQWVKNQLPQQASDNDDLLELYCGNGNFSIALAAQFRSILATEMVRESLHLAHYAKQQNQINNLHFVRLSAQETSQALSRYRQFNRLKHIDLDGYQFFHRAG